MNKQLQTIKHDFNEVVREMIGKDNLETHNNLVELEKDGQRVVAYAVIGRGQLYSNFKGTERETANHFGVSKTTVHNYQKAFSEANLILEALVNSDDQPKVESVRDVLKLVAPKPKTPKPKAPKEDAIDAEVVEAEEVRRELTNGEKFEIWSEVSTEVRGSDNEPTPHKSALKAYDEFEELDPTFKELDQIEELKDLQTFVMVYRGKATKKIYDVVIKKIKEMRA